MAAELSKKTLAGLAHFGDAGLRDDVAKAIITSVFAVATGQEEKQVFDSVEAKQCYASVIALILEAAKHDLTTAELKTMLEDSSVAESRVSALLQQYEKNKSDIRAQLSKLSLNFASVVDVSWRLDYYVKSDLLEQVRQPVYFITLKTREPDGRITDVQFTANFQELQDLLGKVKDAIKQIERIQLRD